MRVRLLKKHMKSVPHSGDERGPGILEFDPKHQLVP